MSDQNPKFDPKANEPTTIKPLKNFKNGASDKGPWYGWEVEDTATGEKYTWFLSDPADQQEIKAIFETGQQAIVTLKLAKGQKPRYDIRTALFDGKGKVTDPPKPSLDSPEGLEAYRKKVKNTLYMAIEDVLSVKVAFAEKWQDGAEANRLFTPDIVQKYATSIVIDYLKRT